MSYGTEVTTELSKEVATVEGRRIPGAMIIFQGGTPGPRGAAAATNLRIKGKVATSGDLPDGSPGEPRAEGDAWIVATNSHIWIFNSTTNAWDDIGLISTGIYSPDGSIGTAVALTQSAYDAIPVKDPLRLYHIIAG